MSEYTEFCVSELRKALRLECSKFEWAEGEKTIEGADFTTRVDVYGKDDGRVVLIQFEMHRGAVSTNALKAAYCLENDHFFRGKQILILHVLSPFYEKPERTGDTKQTSVPEWVPPERENQYRGFLIQQRRMETRESARENAFNHKLLLLFLKRKCLLDSATRIYEVIEWNPADPEVREATIVLPEKREVFPANTQQAVAALAKQLGKVIEEWQKK
jgi:hypothetical protein